MTKTNNNTDCTEFDFSKIINDSLIKGNEYANTKKRILKIVDNFLGELNKSLNKKTILPINVKRDTIIEYKPEKKLNNIEQAYRWIKYTPPCRA